MITERYNIYGPYSDFNYFCKELIENEKVSKFFIDYFDYDRFRSILNRLNLIEEIWDEKGLYIIDKGIKTSGIINF
jgi:hypothetical protein